MTARRMPGPGHKDNTRFVFNNTVTAIYVPSKVIHDVPRQHTRGGRGMPMHTRWSDYVGKSGSNKCRHDATFPVDDPGKSEPHGKRRAAQKKSRINGRAF